MIIYDEKKYENYIKTEVKYARKKPFLFLKENENDTVYKFMVRDEKGVYNIQLWNKELPSSEELKSYLNYHKPLSLNELRERQKIKDKEYADKMTLYKKQKNNKRLYKKRNTLLNKINKKNILEEDLKKEKERLINCSELLSESQVCEFFSKNIKIRNEFFDKNWFYEKIYNINVDNWKQTRNLLRIDDGNVWNFHHIRPKSLFGCDEQSNLVCVTLYEHRLLHSLLTLIYPNSEYMKKAFLMMTFGSDQNTIDMFCYDKFKDMKLSTYLAFMVVYDAIQKKHLISTDEINQHINDLLRGNYENIKKTNEMIKFFMDMFDIKQYLNINVDDLKRIEEECKNINKRHHNKNNKKEIDEHLKQEYFINAFNSNIYQHIS